MTDFSSIKNAPKHKDSIYKVDKNGKLQFTEYGKWFVKFCKKT